MQGGEMQGDERQGGEMQGGEGTEMQDVAAEVQIEEQSAGAPRAMQVDRVVDVPLAVTMRFGQRQLTLRELLELGTGSLLELDRQVEEPVDLMLGDRVIARGEVVIVDGNYGMRITEVLEVPGRGVGRRAQTVGYAHV